MGTSGFGLVPWVVAAGVAGHAWMTPAPVPRAAAAAGPAGTVAAHAVPALVPRQTAADRNIARLRERVRRTGGDAVAHVALGDALMQKSRESMDPHLFAEAESAYEEALAREPRNTAAMLGLAWVHNSEHDFGAGRRWAEKALAIDPALPDAYGLLGDQALELGAYDDAFAYYQRAMDLRPDLSSYSRAAELLWVTGDAARARRLMRRAIDAGGPYAENTAWCRARLARMLLHEGALLLAEQQADAALRLAPDNVHVLVAMGEIKAARQAYSEAIDYYRRAIAVAPMPDALIALGDLHAASGQPLKAEACYQRAVAILSSGGAGHTHGGSHGPAHAHGDARLARFYADHERNLGEALRMAELAYGESRSVHVADTLAWCLYKNGRLDQARKVVREALRWNTPDANILFHAGMIHARLGDRPAAQRYLYQALSLNPRFHVRNAEVAVQTLAALSARPEARPLTEAAAGSAPATPVRHSRRLPSPEGQ